MSLDCLLGMPLFDCSVYPPMFGCTEMEGSPWASFVRLHLGFNVRGLLCCYLAGAASYGLWFELIACTVALYGCSLNSAMFDCSEVCRVRRCDCIAHIDCPSVILPVRETACCLDCTL